MDEQGRNPLLIPGSCPEKEVITMATNDATDPEPLDLLLFSRLRYLIVDDHIKP